MVANITNFKMKKVKFKVKNQKSINNTAPNGFTLVEMIVAVSIFLLIVMVLMQMFEMSLKIQRKFLAKNEAASEISYLMEHLSRAVRMAQKDISGSCIGASNNYYSSKSGTNGEIKFKTSNADCLKIYLQEGSLWETINNASSAYRLTSPKLQVKNFNIAQAGWNNADFIQPRVVISLDLLDANGSPFFLQTTISQRNLDVPI